MIEVAPTVRHLESHNDELQSKAAQPTRIQRHRPVNASVRGQVRHLGPHRQQPKPQTFQRKQIRRIVAHQRLELDPLTLVR